MQVGHNVCIFLVLPHEGHLLRLLTSFRPLPAICLCRFFICDVFFFGTAFRIPSHISSSSEGMFWMAAGIATPSACIEGNSDDRVCCCCVERSVDLKEGPKLAEVSLGKSDDKAEDIRSCCIAAIVTGFCFPDSDGQVWVTPATVIRCSPWLQRGKP